MFIKSINSVMIVGRLGSDPKTITTKSGSACSFSVATNEVYKDKDDMTVNITTWINVVFWGKQAENALKVLNKGDLVAVFGSLANREITIGEETRSTLEIRTEKFELLSKNVSKETAEDVDDVKTEKKNPKSKR